MADPSTNLARSIAQGIQLGQFLGNAGQRVQRNAQNSFLQSQQAFENQIKLGEAQSNAVAQGLKLGQDLRESEQRLALAGQAATQRAEAGDRAQRGLELREIGLANDIDVEIAKKRSKLDSLRAAHEANDRLRGRTTPFTAGATLEAEIQALEQNKSRLNLENLPLGELSLPTVPDGEGELIPGQLLFGDINKDGTPKERVPTDAELDAIANPGLAIPPTPTQPPQAQATLPALGATEDNTQDALEAIDLFGADFGKTPEQLEREAITGEREPLPFTGDPAGDALAAASLFEDIGKTQDQIQAEDIERGQFDDRVPERPQPNINNLSAEEISEIGKDADASKAFGIKVIRDGENKIVFQNAAGEFVALDKTIQEPDLSATGQEEAPDPERIQNQFDADRALVKGLNTLDEVTDLRTTTQKRVVTLKRQLKQVKDRQSDGVASSDLIESIEDRIVEAEAIVDLIGKREDQIEADEKAKKTVEDKKITFTSRQQAYDAAHAARIAIGNLGIGLGGGGAPQAIDDPEFNKFMTSHRSPDDLRRKLINVMRDKSNRDSAGVYPDIEESIDFLQSTAGKDAVKALWESENWLRANKQSRLQDGGTTDNPVIQDSPEDIIKDIIRPTTTPSDIPRLDGFRGSTGAVRG